jgi:hypothetical protein
MAPTVLEIMHEIDTMNPIYHVPETMPHTLARERHTRHRLQLILTLDSPETPRFYWRGL